MEHVVFFPGADGAPAFRRVDSLEGAISLVEHLRNVDGVAEFSIHALTEVPVAFKAYYRAEVPTATEESPVAEAPAAEAPEAEAAPAEVPAKTFVPESLPTHGEAAPAGGSADASTHSDNEPVLVGADAAAPEAERNGSGRVNGLGFFAS